ncbi:MAG: YcaO-like family protein [Candidatus Margulisiibacteriota bacterium]
MILHPSPKQYVFDQSKAAVPVDTVEKAFAALKKLPKLEGISIAEEISEIPSYLHTVVSREGLDTCGKGLTPEQSRASAIMEYCERYSWMNFDMKGYNGYTEASYEEIVKTKVRTVKEDYFLCNFVGIPDKNALLKKIKKIPLKWIKGFSLTHGGDFYYPIRWHNHIFGSNGLAAGNTMEEALTQAISEVIERENVYRFVVEKELADDIDLSSIKHPAVAKTLEEAAAAGIEIILKDVTFGLGVPSFIAYGTNSRYKDTLLHKGVGHGTYPGPEQAVARALAEYFQAFALLNDDIKKRGLDLTAEPNKHYGFLVTYPHDIFYKFARKKPLSEVKNLSKDDFKDEVEMLVSILAKKGYETVVINKIHPELGIPVVRVFVPGLRSVIVSEVYDPQIFILAAQKEAMTGE